MAITWRTATGLSAGADTATPFANRTATLPTGHTSGDLLLLFAGGKPYNTEGSTPTGGEYTQLFSFASGTTGVATGTGSLRLQGFYKTHDGSEANPVQTFTTSYTPWMQSMLAASKTNAGSWTVESTTGSAETTTVNVSGAAQLDFAPGNHVIVVIVHRDDDATHTDPSVTIPGCTLGTLTEMLATNTTTSGNDGAMYVYQAEIVSGTATGVPNFTVTPGASEGWVCVGFVRVVEPTATVNGTAAGTWGGLTGAASGTPTTFGTALGSWGALTGTADGARLQTGTAAGTWGGLTGTSTGTRTVVGAAAGTWGDLTGTANGTVTPGVTTVFGTALGAWGALTGTITGRSLTPWSRQAVATTQPSGPVVYGTGSGAWGALTGTASGLRTVVGTGAGAWGALTGTATGLRTTFGTAAGAWGALVGTASGNVVGGSVSGTGLGAWGALTGAASGTPTTFGAASGAWGALTGTANGTPTTLGTATGAWGALTGTATGTPTTFGTAAGVWGGLVGTATGTGTFVVTGTALGAWGALTGTASGQGSKVGSGRGAWGGLQGASTGRRTVLATCSSQWGGLRGSAFSPQNFALTSWGGMVGAATGLRTVRGSVASTWVWTGSASGFLTTIVQVPAISTSGRRGRRLVNARLRTVGRPESR